MPQTYRRWPTEAEANAFRDGVEHANDSALSVIEIVHDPTHATDPWIVLMLDADADEDDDPFADEETDDEIDEDDTPREHDPVAE